MKIVIFQGEAICSAEVRAGFGRGFGRVRPGSGRVWPGSGRVWPFFGRVQPEFWQGSANDSVLGSL